jgi:hypothetical protein
MHQLKCRSAVALRTLREAAFVTMENLESRVLLSVTLPVLAQPLDTTWQNTAITSQ